MAFSWWLVADSSSCSSIHQTRNSTQVHASIYCPLVIILRRSTLLGDVTRNRKVWIDRLQHVQLKIHIWKFQRFSLKTVSTASLTLLRAALRRSWAPDILHNHTRFCKNSRKVISPCKSTCTKSARYPQLARLCKILYCPSRSCTNILPGTSYRCGKPLGVFLVEGY